MKIWKWVAIGFLLTAAVVWLVRQRVGLDSVDSQTLRRAETAWRQNGLADYDIEIRVTGRQSALYRVAVRGGQPQQAWRNGQPLRQLRTFGTWSVPGMLETIARDVAHASGEIPDRGVGELQLYARFDPTYGFPQFYLRVEHGASNNDVSWEVVEFAPGATD